MHYALHLRTFLYSHYFHFGLRVAVGVIGLTLLALAGGDTAAAMTIGTGALCTSLMDMPSPLRHKVNEMLAAALLCSAVTLIISLATPLPWLLLTLLVVMSFFASMMVVYGKKSMPLQLSVLFIMTLSMEHAMTARQSFIHAAVFLAGGLAYMAYALAIAWCLRHRIRQQVLAEALFELARYVAIKADFYDTRCHLTDQFNLLVQHQSVLAERHQAARDIILRGPQTGKDAIVIQVHVCMLDLYELILSTHTDYALLRTCLADSDALNALRDLARKAARDIEAVGYAVTRKRASCAAISYEPELCVIDASLRELQQRALAGERTHEAQAVLRAQRNKVQAIIHMIGQLHLASQRVQDAAPIWEGADLEPFLSQQQYGLGLMLSNLRLDSPIFRFALRLSMAILAGLLIGPRLPYAAHSYWIVLTIVIILKPSFSVTKQRRSDRLSGTVIGCVLTAVVLHFIQSRLVILAILFLATVAAPSFIYLRYRYTAIAVSMMILLQMHLIAPGGSHLISERLIDTVVGAALASGFSFVLPSWEYRGLPRLIRQVLEANLAYMEASFALLRGAAADDFRYRLERKRLMDSLAGLSGALMRMLDEPAGKQRAAYEMNQFVVQNYLLVAHVAALRSLLRRHARDLPADAVDGALRDTAAGIAHTLALALQHQGPGGALVARPAPAAPLAGTAEEGAAAWSGWPLLARRLRLLQVDADQVAIHSAAIVR